MREKSGCRLGEQRHIAHQTLVVGGATDFLGIINVISKPILHRVKFLWPFSEPKHTVATTPSLLALLHTDGLEDAKLLAGGNQCAGYLWVPVDFLGLLVVVDK